MVFLHVNVIYIYIYSIFQRQQRPNILQRNETRCKAWVAHVLRVGRIMVGRRRVFVKGGAQRDTPRKPQHLGSKLQHFTAHSLSSAVLCDLETLKFTHCIKAKQILYQFSTMFYHITQKRARAVFC